MNEEIKTRVGAKINEALEDRGISIRAFAIAMEATYEHIRRIVRGESLPSKPMLRQMAEHLGLDASELIQDLAFDSITKRWGGLPQELSNKKPGMATIERCWDDLNPEQQEDLTNFAVQWAKRANQRVKA